MKTICTSIQINRIASQMGGDPEFLASCGEGDNKLTAWRLPNGARVIETNAEPIFEDSEPEAFAVALTEIDGE